ncbi:MAG: redox-active disulfide protein 2 [Phascolarctobacterium sp.]|nr:MAG: redox-active disulfide protein 2 [Phascolarctobacterium sp.]
MQIKVLGPMTKPVEVLFQNAAVAAKKLKCPAKFERVSELRRIVAYGALALPALVIDGKVVAGGQTLGVEEIMEIIKQMQ